MDSVRFTQLCAMYAPQCTLLGIQSLHAIEFDNDHDRWMMQDDGQKITLKVSNQEHDAILLTDFSYLQLFPNLTELWIVNDNEIEAHHENYRSFILGKGMYKSPALKIIGVEHMNISEFHEDFRFISKKLTELMVQGSVAMINRRFRLNALLVLIVGDLAYRSQVDFTQLGDMPNIIQVFFKNVELRSFDPLKIRHVNDLTFQEMDIRQIDDSWFRMENLHSLKLWNANFTRFPQNAANFPHLGILSLANSLSMYFPSAYRNNFSLESIHLRPPFTDLAVINLDMTNVRDVQLYAVQGQQSRLNSLSIRNPNLVRPGTRNLRSQIIVLDNPNASVHLTNSADFFPVLESVDCAGTLIPFFLLKQPGLVHYGGGFVISPDDLGQTRQINTNDIMMGNVNPNIRERYIRSLIRYNPNITFTNTPTTEEVRQAPYFCLYTPNTITENPFNDKTCAICQNGFLENEHDINSDLGNAFLANTDDLPENNTVVFCNFNAQDHVQHIEDHYHHFFHLSCYQEWIRSSKTCPYTRDTFKVY